MNYRKGDVVSVQGVVKHDFNKDDPEHRVFVDIPGTYETLWMEPSSLTLVQHHFEIGDSVTWDEHGAGIIHAIKDHHAWIGMASGDYCTRLLTSIKRADAPEA